MSEEGNSYPIEMSNFEINKVFVVTLPKLLTGLVKLPQVSIWRLKLLRYSGLPN